MVEEIDLLANCKWSDTGLNKRLNKIEYQVKRLIQSDTLMELNSNVDELIDYAISTHSNMIGDYSNG